MLTLKPGWPHAMPGFLLPNLTFVIPAKAGTQPFFCLGVQLGSRFRGNDEMSAVQATSGCCCEEAGRRTNGMVSTTRKPASPPCTAMSL